MAIGAWVRTRRVNVLKREKPHLCLVSLMVKPRFEGPVISVRLGDQAPECYERPNGDRGLEVVAPHRRMRQEVRASQRSVWPPPEAVKWYAPAHAPIVQLVRIAVSKTADVGPSPTRRATYKNTYTARLSLRTDSTDTKKWFSSYHDEEGRALNMYIPPLSSTYLYNE